MMTVLLVEEFDFVVAWPPSGVRLIDIRPDSYNRIRLYEQKYE